MPNNTPTREEFDKLKRDLDDLISEVYLNNFSASKDENKYVRFKTRMRVPTYATAPATCEQGELYMNSGTGKLYVASATNTWSLVGTQA